MKDSSLLPEVSGLGEDVPKRKTSRSQPPAPSRNGSIFPGKVSTNSQKNAIVDQVMTMIYDVFKNLYEGKRVFELSNEELREIYVAQKLGLIKYDPGTNVMVPKDLSEKVKNNIITGSYILGLDKHRDPKNKEILNEMFSNLEKMAYVYELSMGKPGSSDILYHLNGYIELLVQNIPLRSIDKYDVHGLEPSFFSKIQKLYQYLYENGYYKLLHFCASKFRSKHKGPVPNLPNHIKKVIEGRNYEITTYNLENAVKEVMNTHGPGRAWEYTELLEVEHSYKEIMQREFVRIFLERYAEVVKGGDAYGKR